MISLRELQEQRAEQKHIKAILTEEAHNFW